MTAGQSQRFCLITPSGWGNLGDVAIQEAVISHLRQRLPNCDITAFSLNPQDTEQRFGVPAYPISGLSIIPGYWVRTEREPVIGQKSTDNSTPVAAERSTDDRGVKGRLRRVPFLYGSLKFTRQTLKPLENALKRVYSDIRHIVRSAGLARGANAVVVSGGGQIDDFWGGTWGHPYTLFKWALISRLVGARYIFLGVGTCSLSSSLSRFFVRRALSMADRRSFRDRPSLELARAFGAVESDAVIPDLAFALGVQKYVQVSARASESRTVIVSPMCYCDPRIWPTKNAAVYNHYLHKLAEVSARLVADGWKVVMVPSDTTDNMAIQDCLAALKKIAPEIPPDDILAPVIESVDDLLKAIVPARGVIASRLHGVILSFAVLKPVLSLSYDRKVRTLVTEMDQTAYCLEIEDFAVVEVLSRFKQMIESSDHVTGEIADRVTRFRETLNSHFDGIFTE